MRIGVAMKVTHNISSSPTPSRVRPAPSLELSSSRRGWRSRIHNRMANHST